MENKTKHTPGPWKISECPTDREIRVVVTDPTTERCSIAIVASYAPMYDLMAADTKEDWANARLIAAAPELLAACKEDDRIESLYAERSEICARLNGRDRSIVEGIRIDRARLHEITVELRTIREGRRSAIAKAEGR